MSKYDFNTADAPRAMGALMPEGTKVMLTLSLRPGGCGDGGWLKNTNAGDAGMLDMEFTVDGGEFAKRKVWGNYLVEGNGSSGHDQATSISRSMVRGILESARNILPGLETPEAVTGRQISGWGDLDGLRFPAVLGVEKGSLRDKTAGPNSERYADKNVLKLPIAPDDADYLSPGPQQARAAGMSSVPQQSMAQAAPAASPVQKPSWAA